MKLLRTLILRPLWRDPLRTSITILAVALGIAVVVAIDLAASAAAGSFRSSLETLTRATDFEVFTNGGIDEEWFGRLSALPVDARFSPVIEAEVVVPGIGAVPLYGIDMIGSRPRGGGKAVSVSTEGDALASGALARRLPDGLRFTANVEGKTHELHAVSLENPGEAEYLVMDIAACQELLGRFGKLDRIDAVVDPGEDRDRVEKLLRATLPAAYSIDKPGARSEENQKMLGAFRLNLRALSYISLLVGAFLIYNTISVSVVRRRAEIGILRAVGAGRATVLGVFLTEALLLGIVGASLGALLGRVMAEGAVHLVSDTVNALYTTSRPSALELSLVEFLITLATGALVAFFSALAPAREAMNVPPTEAMSRGAHEHRAQLRWKRWLAGAAAAGALALAASQMPAVNGFPLGGYVAALLAVSSAALAAPALVLAVNRLLRAATRRRAESLLASRGLTASLSRTSVVVSALATAIAMMASVGIMVGSFRETVSVWLDQQLQADLHVRAAVRPAPGEFPPVDARVAGIAESLPGVEAVERYHGMEIHFRGMRPTLGAGDMEIARNYGRLRFLPGQDRDGILRSMQGRDIAIAGEPFANRFHLHVGDPIELSLGGRTVTFTLAGIFYDYAGGQGRMVIDRATLLKYLPDQPMTNAAIYLAHGADIASIERELQLRAATYGVTITRNAEIRRFSMSIFDRTFAVTWALEAVAIVVAVLGAANSLLALVLDRRRSLGLLRYLGASTQQIRGMILAEAAFLGGFALLAGLALGWALSLLLVFVVNKQSFGWTIQFHPPAGLLAGALLLVWFVTVLAGLYPARVASRLNPIDVIHEE
jgi:putative ABC transport system permease protein